MENEEKMVFSILSENMSAMVGGGNEASYKITNYNEALSWLKDFENADTKIYADVNGKRVEVYGFSFDVSDIQKVVAGLNDNNHEFYIGFGKRSNDTYTLIVGAVELNNDPIIGVTRKFIVEPGRDMYDYCNPCPPGNPKSVKFIP